MANNRKSYIFVVERAGKYAVRMRINHLDSVAFTEKKLINQGFSIKAFFDAGHYTRDQITEAFDEFLAKLVCESASDQVTNAVIEKMSRIAGRQAYKQTLKVAREDRVLIEQANAVPQLTTLVSDEQEYV